MKDTQKFCIIYSFTLQNKSPLLFKLYQKRAKLQIATIFILHNTLETHFLTSSHFTKFLSISNSDPRNMLPFSLPPLPFHHSSFFSFPSHSLKGRPSKKKKENNNCCLSSMIKVNTKIK